MNPLLLSQTNRECFVAMCILKGEKNINSFYEPHFVLQNISENIGEKEVGKIGAEFPPDPPSTPAVFRSRSLEKNWREDLSVLLSHYGSWVKLLGQVLKIWLRIFLKKSSNFVQKTQPVTTFISSRHKSPGFSIATALSCPGCGGSFQFSTKDLIALKSFKEASSLTFPSKTSLI
jgi:hypothetical protein